MCYVQLSSLPALTFFSTQIVIAVSWMDISYRFKEGTSLANVSVNASDRFSNARQVHTRPTEIKSRLPSDYFTSFMGSGPNPTVDFLGVTYYTASCEYPN